MKIRTIAASLMAAGALFGAGTASAQDFSYGESLFQRNCAVCHGAVGEGDGPVADLFAVRPSNLRAISKNNNGVFPFSQIYQAIKEGQAIQGHGTSEMPIWGELFNAEAEQKTMHPGVDADEIVQSRILALVYYIQSVQE